MIQDRSPQAEVAMTFEQYEDEDAHIDGHPPAEMTAAEVEQVAVAVGERCHQRLLATGLFLVSAVGDERVGLWECEPGYFLPDGGWHLSQRAAPSTSGTPAYGGNHMADSALHYRYTPLHQDIICAEAAIAARGCQVNCVTFFTWVPAPRTESQTD